MQQAISFNFLTINTPRKNSYHRNNEKSLLTTCNHMVKYIHFFSQTTITLLFENTCQECRPYMDLIHYKFSQYFLNATIAKLLNPPFQTVLEFSNVRMGEFHYELLNHLQTIYLEKNDFSQNAYNCCTFFQNARFGLF